MPFLRLSLVLALLLAAALPARADDPSPAPSPADVAKIQKIIADYLKAHPEVVVDALPEYQKKQDALKADAARKTIASAHNELLNDAANPAGGNPKGDVTVVEFFDYRCP